ncbi:MAG: hypothetical protein MUP58_01025 [Candidatus Nanohaloarchaeota archaeon QJJ-9]|nr:hypothetical protein [Candidatus Nanohaloarchaeota archaeon QJJ-9]
MSLKTSQVTVENSVKEAGIAYLQSRSRKLRHIFLARSIANSGSRGSVLLLSFTDPREGYWSFDLESTINLCSIYLDVEKVKEKLEIERITPSGTPAGKDWKDLWEKDYTQVVGYGITNLGKGINNHEYSALERAAEELSRVKEDYPVVIIDKRKPYKRLADLARSIAEVGRKGDQIYKQTYKPVAKRFKAMKSRKKVQSSLKSYRTKARA